MDPRIWMGKGRGRGRWRWTSQLSQMISLALEFEKHANN